MNAREKDALSTGEGQIVMASQELAGVIAMLEKGQLILAGVHLQEARHRIAGGLEHLRYAATPTEGRA